MAHFETKDDYYVDRPTRNNSSDLCYNKKLSWLRLTANFVLAISTIN